MARLAAEPDPELERDETEEVDPLLYAPEEMDLLGEIFDTLGSRSSREHGLLYGTRSLDLFGPDSQDYIIKVKQCSECTKKILFFKSSHYLFVFFSFNFRIAWPHRARRVYLCPSVAVKAYTAGIWRRGYTPQKRNPNYQRN